MSDLAPQTAIGKIGPDNSHCRPIIGPLRQAINLSFVRIADNTPSAVRPLTSAPSRVNACGMVKWESSFRPTAVHLIFRPYWELTDLFSIYEAVCDLSG